VNCPTAVSWPVVPRATDRVVGAKVMDVSAAGSTVRVVEPVTEPEVAVIVTLPTPKVVANPELSTDARAAFEELQVTEERVADEPSLNKPVATKGWFIPCGIEG
jgi:hypothetical protein